MAVLLAVPEGRRPVIVCAGMPFGLTLAFHGPLVARLTPARGSVRKVPGKEKVISRGQAVVACIRVIIAAIAQKRESARAETKAGGLEALI